MHRVLESGCFLYSCLLLYTQQQAGTRASVPPRPPSSPFQPRSEYYLKFCQSSVPVRALKRGSPAYMGQDWVHSVSLLTFLNIYGVSAMCQALCWGSGKEPGRQNHGMCPLLGIFRRNPCPQYRWVQMLRVPKCEPSYFPPSMEGTLTTALWGWKDVHNCREAACLQDV